MINWEIVFVDEDECVIEVTNIDLLYEISQAIMRGKTERELSDQESG